MTDDHVVVGMDGSLVAVRALNWGALDWGAEEAVRRGTALRIVYAVAERDEEGQFWPRPPSGSTNATPVLLVETSAMEGGAVATLAAGSEGVAVTVVGTRGLGSVTGLLAGSVSRRLAARVHPSVVARGSHSLRKAARGAARPGERYRRGRSR
ncbi:universal stress protein [Streptomyces chilikensis]|uniref:universal stress protein n=1 Tax=Streptomyces chilikensis TaxID=1194079 RepID=UPI000AFABF40|nr:universal stress protein [Streptomyces chilikensis]